MAVRVVFLDRDGVINRAAPQGDYVKGWEEFEFLPEVHEAIRLLNENAFRVIVVSNQRGVSLGRMKEEDLATINSRMQAELRKAGARIDGIYYCPHDYNRCRCRKPDVGLFLQAQHDFPEIDLSTAFVVGDSASDMEAGHRLGCKNILIAGENSSVRGEVAEKSLQVDYVARSLWEAVTSFLLAERDLG